MSGGENTNSTELDKTAHNWQSEGVSDNKKYDWDKMKQDYFTSDYLLVSEFIRNRLNISSSTVLNWRIKDKIVGRWAEKRELKKYAVEQAKEEILKDAKKRAAARYKPDPKLLDNMHQGILTLVNNELARMVESHKPKQNKDGTIRTPALDMKKLETLWKMTKTEKLEPTNITKQTVVEDDSNDIDPAGQLLDQLNFDEYDEDIEQEGDNLSTETQALDN